MLVLLHASCPEGWDVTLAPLDVVLADDTALQPDLLVARRDDFTARNLPVPQVLAVEIVSPSTRLIDLNLKKARFERAGSRRTGSLILTSPACPRGNCATGPTSSLLRSRVTRPGPRRRRTP